MVDRRQVYEPRGFQLRRTNPSSGLTLFFTYRRNGRAGVGSVSYKDLCCHGY